MLLYIRLIRDSIKLFMTSTHPSHTLDHFQGSFLFFSIAFVSALNSVTISINNPSTFLANFSSLISAFICLSARKVLNLFNNPGGSRKPSFRPYTDTPSLLYVIQTQTKCNIAI